MGIKTTEVFFCDICKKEFNSSKQMNICFRKCSIKKDRNAFLEKARKITEKFRLTLKNINDFAPYFNELSLEADLGIKITQLDLRFDTLVSNSHSSPLNGVTNWSRVSDIPSGYPGWCGQFQGTNIRYEEYETFFNVFSYFFPGVNTGSGSGGDKFNYSLSIFIDDFPKIKSEYEKYLELNPKYVKFQEEIKLSESRLHHYCENSVSNNTEIKALKEQYLKMEKELDVLKGMYYNKRTELYNEVKKSVEKEYTIEQTIDLDEIRRLYNMFTSRN